MPPTFEQVTDGAWVLHHNRDSGLPVALLRTTGKGWGLFATRRIARGEDVALYKLRVLRRDRFDTDRVVGWQTTQVLVDGQGRVSVGDGARVPALWDGGTPPPAGPHAVVRLRGTVDTVELEGGHTFANPLLNQDDSYSCNVYDLARRTGTNDSLVANVYGGSVPRARRGVPFWGQFVNEPDQEQRDNVECHPDRGCKPSPRSGDTIVYRLVATRDVQAGSEVLWSYGTAYDRDYASIGEKAPRLWRAVGVEAQRGHPALEYLVRWSDGRRTWETGSKLERGQGVRLLNAWQALQQIKK